MAHDVWGEQVQAAVVLRAGQTATADDLIAHAEADLAGYKMPRAVHILEALPRNSTGKVLKRALRDEFEAV
ncbi:AMP-binding enzyme [Kordiimonas gwangyangensis]|uniref:AMP-binding enzyme n=1 Tax=Kordiimonas gwangyangensis TaxID=288022 RepID=UPI001EE1A7B3|nr:hypothetical protein [Kordiimonas gwangyangensis]